MFQVRYLYTGVVDQAALDSDELAVNLLEARMSSARSQTTSDLSDLSSTCLP